MSVGDVKISNKIKWVQLCTVRVLRVSTRKWLDFLKIVSVY